MNKKISGHFPSWLDESPCAVYGGWEPLMYLRRDRGETDWEEPFLRQHSDEGIRLMARGGVDIFITHYHKGHGWKIISGELRDIKRQVRTMKRAGIVPGVYFRVDNIFGETFFLERPEANDWLVVNDEGKHPCILNRPFRLRVCRNVPAYREYVRKVPLYAVREIGAKIISLDGFTGLSERDECRCGHCRGRFRKFLRKRWQNKKKEAERFFGFSRVDGIEIPPVAGGNRSEATASVITDPVYQEYIRFRCEDWAEWHRFVMSAVLAADDQVVVSLNCGVFSWQNTVAQSGVHLPWLNPKNTMVFIEDGHFPWVHQGGVISHRIRDYKIASVLGLKCIAYCHEHNIPYLKRAVCESLAFNNGVVGHISHDMDVDRVFEKSPLPETRKSIIAWRKKNGRLWRNLTSASEIGVLRGYESMAFDCYHSWRHTMLLEETLIRKQLPFDPVFDGQLDELLGTRLKLLVLAGQSCLSDAVIEKIASFVAAGGSLLVTGQTGGRTTWATWRRENALVRALALPAESLAAAGVAGSAETASRDRFETLATDRDRTPATASWPARPAFFERVLGKGSVAYIPDIVPAVEEEVWYPNWSVNQEHGYFDINGNIADPRQRTHKEYPFVNWRLPVNAGQITDAIRRLYRAAPFIIDAPDTTAVNWLKKTDAPEEILHFLNYANDGVVAGASLFLLANRYRRACFHVMDPEECVVDLSPQLPAGRIRLPGFLTYGILVLATGRGR